MGTVSVSFGAAMARIALPAGRSCPTMLQEKCETLSWRPALVAAPRADSSRTIYLFDVRGPDEYQQGHLAGSDNALGAH